MTFDSAAYAINGPEIGSALARRAVYASSRQSGIVQKDDLKVTDLSVPGVGIQISEGVGLVLNGYQTDPNEVYVVNNPGVHTVPASEMPAANPSAKSYIVAIVVGDVDFNQAGHPWMPSTLAPEEVEDFQYVRPTLIPVSAGAKTLSVNYPALVLARIDIPANTTTILQNMITDLRNLAAPRQSQEMFVGQPWTNGSPRYIPAGAAYADWGPQEFSPSVAVPEWATRAIVVCSINGVRVDDPSGNIVGGVRTQLGSVTGPSASFDLPASSTGPIRLNLQTAGEYDVTSVAGSNQNLRVEGFESSPASPTNAKKLALRGGSQMIFDVRFFEE